MNDGLLAAGLSLDRDLHHPETGQTLLTRGTVLTEGLIRKILRLGLQHALDQALARPAEPGGAGASGPAGESATGPVVSYGLRVEGKMVITRLMDEARALLGDQGTARAAWDREAAWTQAEEFAEHLVCHLGQSSLESYREWRLYDAYALAHPFNTAILSVLIGQALGLHGDKLHDLALAALVADIGLAWLPPDLLNKTGPLEPQERDQIRAHVRYSVAILRNFRQTRGLISHVAASHHERTDGTGYPEGSKHLTSFDGTQIVGLADSYDAVLCDRPYRKRLEPAVAYRIITSSPGFGQGVVTAFSRRVAPYPKGTRVKLNTGQEGEVVQIRQTQPLKPVVRIAGEFVDLAESPQMRVTGHVVPRRFDRLTHRLPVQIRTAEGRKWQATTVDLSLEGLGLEADGLPPSGQNLYLTVLAGGQPVNAIGQIVWSGAKTGSKASFAVSFVPDSQSDQEQLVDTLWNLA